MKLIRKIKTNLFLIINTLNNKQASILLKKPPLNSDLYHGNTIFLPQAG